MITTNNPTHLRINGEIYKINTDFRVWIIFERLWFDVSVTEEAKTKHIFNIIFEKPPQPTIDAIKTLINFYVCGRQNFKKTVVDDSETIYDFKLDHQRIKAAFIAKFHFDPWNMSYYHWFDFKGCFDSLLGASFENTVKARTIDLKDFKGEQLTEMRKIKEANKIWTKAEILEHKEREKADAEAKEAIRNGNYAEYLRKINNIKEV